MYKGERFVILKARYSEGSLFWIEHKVRYSESLLGLGFRLELGLELSLGLGLGLEFGITSLMLYWELQALE